MSGRVDSRTHGGNVRCNPGGGVIVHNADRFDLVICVRGKLSFYGFGIGTCSPVALHEDRVEP